MSSGDEEMALPREKCELGLDGMAWIGMAGPDLQARALGSPEGVEPVR